ncbi:MAG TPA: STY4851/ECs_5259 family protein [Caulobacteraceae bacterium]|nr:STY4851/ECs_5259 family protein [Caulobacteraceae bacterium]
MAKPDAPSQSILQSRFAAARGSLSALEALNEDLRQLSGDAAVDLQCEVMAAIQSLRSGAGPAPAGVAALDLVGTIRERAQAPRQPLYRYGVSDGEFDGLRARLDTLHRLGALEQANDRSAATFVLYCAEWFRREYDGGGYSWEAPYPQLIRALSAEARKSLARQGLAWWGRAPRRLAHGELRLMSLALEGGFPTRLLESRQDARIPLHLVRLLARVEAAGPVDEERATELSRTLGSTLGTYDHEEFHALCAELVLAIVRLKAEAAAGAPASVAATAWLDGARPGWRDELPIGLAGEGARRLLDDLVSARAIRLGGGDARAHRLLRWDGAAWRPAVRLGMDGEIDLRRTRFRPVDGRLRAHAAGALASVLAGELGMIEPPTEDEQGWLCRPRGGGRLAGDAPFDTAAEIELRAGTENQSLVWPQGEPLRAEVLLFADPRGDADRAPGPEMELVAQGSARTRRPRLFCWTPLGFVARPLEGGDPIAPLWSGAAACLFDVNRPMRVEPSGGGDHYRVEVGADDERAEQLVVEGELLRGVESADAALPIYSGTPTIRVRRRAEGRAEATPAGEVHWRRFGEAVWRDWRTAPPTHGAIEVVWRDPASRALRDRQRFVVTPRDLSIQTRPTGGLQVAIELSAPAGWRLRAAEMAQLEVTETADGLEARFTGRPSRRLPLWLDGPGFEPVQILVRARLAQGGFFRSDGRKFADRAPVMLDDLRGATAFADGRERIYLSGPAHGESRVQFEDETPLWALSEEIDRLLSGGSELDDKVTLEFGRGEGPRLDVGRYAATLGRVVNGVVQVESRDDVARGPQRLEWFSILEPGYRLIADGEGPAPLPESCVGPGVAVLREGECIVGRPTLALGAPPDLTADWCELQQASMTASVDQRSTEIGRAIRNLKDDTPEAPRNRDYLRALVSRLNGLPPSAMDALRRVAAEPAALATLLATTTDADERASIWALERDLPFLWCLVPIETWRGAFALQRTHLERLLAAGMTADRGAGIAAEAVTNVAESLARLEPMLRLPLTYAGLGVAQDAGAASTMGQAANDRVARTAHLVDDNRAYAPTTDAALLSCFRAGDADLRAALPDFSGRFLPAHWEGLDAPCAAALAAAGQARLSRRQVLRARAARAEEPIAFADLFAACLSSLAQGRALSC